MKILILNQDWLADEFKAAGHEVKTCGIRSHLDFQITPFVHIHKIMEHFGWKEEPDLLLIHDESSPWYVVGLESLECPIVFYAVDTHHHLECHKYMVGACNRTYFAQKDYLKDLILSECDTDWLPLWASRYVDASSEKKYQCSFVGNLDVKLNPERVVFFDKLKKSIPIYTGMGQYWDIFPFSEIVINQTVKGDLNFRVFETMMCGPLLMTEISDNGLLDLFKDGEHLVTYTKGNCEEVTEKVNYYLSHPKLMREIAEQGRAEVLAQHTPQARADRLIRESSSLPKTRYMPNLGQVPSMNWAARKLLKHQSVYSLSAIQHSVRLLQRGLNAGELILEDFAWNIVYACLEYDRLFKSNFGENILNLVSEANPDLKLTRVASIWYQLNRGELDKVNQSLVELNISSTKESYVLIDQVIKEILQPEVG